MRRHRPSHTSAQPSTTASSTADRKCSCACRLVNWLAMVGAERVSWVMLSCMWFL
jgi:hypothetical protein